jgi:DNA replication protein DnaC
MLTHPLLEKLQHLRFIGMLDALEEQMQMPDIGQLSFEDRLGLLVDRETTYRDNRRVKTRLKKAKLRHNACVEDVDFRSPRKLDKTLFMQLADCRWLKEHNNVLIIGPTGIGKSYLACALAQKACREGHSAFYFRLPRLLHDLSIAKADGRYDKLLKTIARIDLLILDDWGLDTFIKEQRHDILEILEDRHGVRSTLVTSQLPVKAWHDVINDPTLADAILDRLVHNAYRLILDGPSMRRLKSPLADGKKAAA